MNAMPDSIIVNSCQYTPVYLIQDPGASQGQSYFIAQSSIEEPKHTIDNLKSFYENSGNLDNTFVNVNTSPKPRILKKQDNGVVGNNLKLASFLLPKNENANKQHYVVNNVILKPSVTLSNSTHTCNSVNNSNIAVTSTVNTSNTVNTVPRLNIDSKIVKLKDTTFNGTALKSRYQRVEKSAPKIKPKELPPILQAPSKHTSVQLLKLGETYHSLNQLSDEQMKMVSQALKIFSDPDKMVPEPAYDPVTNTQFIYKVVSPRDLTVVGKNTIIKEKKLYEAHVENIKTEAKKDNVIKNEPRRETLTKELKKDLAKDTKKETFIREVIKKESNGKDNGKKEGIIKDTAKKEGIVKDTGKKEGVLKETVKKEGSTKDAVKKEIVKEPAKKDSTLKHDIKKENNVRKNEEKMLKHKIQKELEEQQELAEASVEVTPPKVTRSGRKVKLPKLGITEGVTYKPKKKNTLLTCFQCSTEFPSLYRLQKHYETHPTHIPAKIHSNLFHCLLAIVKSGTEGDRTNIFIQQLEQLIVKLRSLLPCVLRSSEKEGRSCTISEEVGRLLGVNPGKYNLDIEALSCVKNKDGYCQHSPPPTDLKQEQNGTQSWITMNNEDILATTQAETEDCARINSVEKWPTVNKRVWKQKQQKSQENAKRMRLASENCDILIELGMEDLATLGTPNECSEEQSSIIKEQGAEQKADHVVIKIECNDIPEQNVCANNVEQEPLDTSCTFGEPTETVLQTDRIEDQKKKSNHAQFHSAHFDIRSSPIKPTSTVFRKFQINPQLLAKYEAQIIRSIETVDKGDDTDKDIPCPTVEEVLQTTENVLETSADVLHTNENVSETSADILHVSDNVLLTNGEVLHVNENALQTSQDVLQTNENVLTSQDVLRTNDVRDVMANDDTLQEIFRDEELSAVKESFILDRELKDWILNRSNDDKSEDGFIRSTSLIQPALLHVKDDEIKSDINIGQKVGILPSNDNHDESSVLNFLDTLATDCLSYPGTEIRTNNGDFQLDLFSFHS